MRVDRPTRMFGLIAIAAYLVACAASFGGVTLCTGLDGQARLEVSCSHEHCPKTSASRCPHAGQDHDCQSCPCEDDVPEAIIAAPVRTVGDLDTLLPTTHPAPARLDPAFFRITASPGGAVPTGSVSSTLGWVCIRTIVLLL